MNNILVLTANGGQATVFGADSPTSALTELKSFDNPLGRADAQDINTDSPGRVRDGLGSANTLSVEVGPQEKEQVRFAKRLAEHLESERQSNSFDRLIVVAGPQFLGMLRDKFSTPLSDLVTVEMDKDYTSLRADELRKRLPELL